MGARSVLGVALLLLRLLGLLNGLVLVFSGVAPGWFVYGSACSISISGLTCQSLVSPYLRWLVSGFLGRRSASRDIVEGIGLMNGRRGVGRVLPVVRWLQVGAVAAGLGVALSAGAGVALADEGGSSGVGSAERASSGDGSASAVKSVRGQRGSSARVGDVSPAAAGAVEGVGGVVSPLSGVRRGGGGVVGVLPGGVQDGSGSGAGVVVGGGDSSEVEGLRAARVSASSTTDGGQAPAGTRWSGATLSADQIVVPEGVAPEMAVRRAQGVLATMRLAGTLDEFAVGLADSPLGVVGDVLAGGVWLLRRSLTPTGSDVGFGGVAGCVDSGDCSGQDLRGANLFAQTLTGVDFSGADLRFANLNGAILTDADLSDANLAHSNLANTHLAGVVLTEGTALGGAIIADHYIDEEGQVGSGEPSTEISDAPLPERDLLTYAWNGSSYAPTFNLYSGVVNGKYWYQNEPYLRGTIGAPIVTGFAGAWADGGHLYQPDGVKGLIKNNSADTIIVETYMSRNEGNGSFFPSQQPQRAILEPGDEMSYIATGDGEASNGEIRGIKLFRASCNGLCVPEGTGVEISLDDPYWGYPTSKINWGSGWLQTRKWSVGESHHEIWGDSQLWIKRDEDGWTIPYSDEYARRVMNISGAEARDCTICGSFNRSATTSDWATFNIYVDKLNQ